jgi:hypothetical protein
MPLVQDGVDCCFNWEESYHERAVPGKLFALYPLSSATASARPKETAERNKSNNCQ